MKVVQPFWRLLTGAQRRRLVLVIGLALVMSVSTLVGVASVVPFFAVLGEPGMIARHPWLAWLHAHIGKGGQQGFLVALGAVLLGMTALASLINLAGSLLINRFAYGIGNHFCSALFREYLHRDAQFHLQGSSARLFNHVIWEVSRGTCGLLQSFLMLTNALATSLLLLGCIVLVHPLLGLLSLGVLGLSYGLVYFFTRRRLLFNGHIESRQTEERIRTVNESFGGIRELILLDARELYQRRFEDSCTAITKAAADTAAIAQSPRHVLDFLVAAALVLGALLTLQEQGSAGDWLARLSFLALAAYRLLPALQQIFQGLVRIRADSVAFSQVAPDLDRACHPPAKAALDSATSWQGRPCRSIEVKAVSFRYSGERPAVLQDVTLTIPAGSLVGIVGPSGSGKTTLAELLLGLLRTETGVIEIDSIPLTQEHIAAWQRTVAYVPQQPFLFDTTLAHNIALTGRWEDIDYQRLAWALDAAQLRELARALPNGHHERIGEKGIKLSGGQRQRIGIARALYRRASLLVLDEPTSALDGETERDVISAISELAGSCTIVLIAHLASTLRHCDRVYALEGGRVVADGSWRELGSSVRLRERLADAQGARARLE